MKDDFESIVKGDGYSRVCVSLRSVYLEYFISTCLFALLELSPFEQRKPFK